MGTLASELSEFADEVTEGPRVYADANLPAGVVRVLAGAEAVLGAAAWSTGGRVVPILGGYEDKTRPPRGATKDRLVVRGFAIMGGIEIKN